MLERLEHRNERLGLVLRFTYAFHAREVRFERSSGERFERIFPETFSFRVEQHDPTELYLQLEDLWSNPRRIAPQANRRDSEGAMRRLVFAVARYLERLIDRLEAEGRLDAEGLDRVYGDACVLVHVLQRFAADKHLDREAELRIPCFHLRKLALRTLRHLIGSRVDPDYLERYVAGRVQPFDENEEVSETGLFYALARGGPEEQSRWLVGMGRRAFHRWLEDVVLDEENQAFEIQASPFADREHEVLAAISRDGQRITRGRDFVPFLRRRGSRDCLRALGRLEAWFLRQYDIHHSAAMIQHLANLESDRDDAGAVLSRHSARNYVLALLALASPFLAAFVGYARAPRLFDLVCSAEVALVLAGVFWFLLYRFCWQRDLTFFHASVPRIGAGIIVGYLPVFLIDEVWDLARGPWFTLLAVVMLLGFATLLYLYVEVQRRLGDSAVAFRRARSIFLLGAVEAFALGLIATSLFGRFMVIRNWGDVVPGVVGHPAFDAVRAGTPIFAGDLPRIVGIEPLVAFPTAVLLMTFLSFFIGTFLQLMWEDIPLTEPL